MGGGGRRVGCGRRGEEGGRVGGGKSKGENSMELCELTVFLSTNESSL